MKSHYFSVLAALVGVCHAATPSQEKITEVFSLAKTYAENVYETATTTSTFPRSTQKGYQGLADWTCGFYAGNLWLIHEFTKEPEMRKKAETITALLEPNKHYKVDHDIGFIMDSSYGNGYRITKNPAYKGILIEAAKQAATRYNPTVKSIMSWNPTPERDWKFPVIIDNMMNVEILLRASEFTGDALFHDIAINHANTTLKNQYRDDGSCSHVVDYDPATGAFRKRDWNNGDDNPSTATWSRGQSWGLYGYTVMYKNTKAKTYLAHAEKIANFLITHKNMPEDMVPYWDYRAPEYPTMRDASAAAILASGLLDLAPLSQENGRKYYETAGKILTSLTSAPYFNTSGKGNFLLNHATGNFLRKSELDAGLVYADYYFLEALLRYHKLDPGSLQPVQASR